MIPSKKNSLFLLLFLFPLIVDGLCSYSGIYSTTNSIRIVTGMLFGVALPFFILPLYSFSLIEKNPIPVIKHFNEIFIPLLLASFLSFITYYSFISYAFIHLIIIGTVLGWGSLLFFLFYKRLDSKNISVFLAISSTLIVLTILSFIHKIIGSYLY